MFLGGVSIIGLISLIGLFAWLFLSPNNLNIEETNTFVKSSMMEIFTDIDLEKIKKHTDEKFLTATTEKKLEIWIDTIKQLGSLIAITSNGGQVTTSIGNNKTARYQTVLLFSTGEVHVNSTLLHTDNGWKYQAINLRSDAFVVKAK